MINSLSNHPSKELLPFFPASLPDETIGSRISRYHILRGQPTAHTTYRQLFNQSPFSLTTLVQPHLDKLAARLPGSPKFNLKTIQKENTLLPLFQHFSSTHIMCSNPLIESDIRTVEQPRRINGKSALTHICPHCLIEDEKVHAYSYIHRSHQIPGVTVCWKHEVKLLDRCPECQCPFAQPNQLILSAWLGCTCGYNISNCAKAESEPATEVEIGFARFTQALLTADPIQLNTTQLAKLYRKRAADLGFSRGTGLLNRNALFEQLEEYFGAELLSKIDNAYKSGKLSGWFIVVSLSAALEAPLYRHLLLSYFLFRNAQFFLEQARCANQECVAIEADENIQSEKKIEDELVRDMIEAAQRYNCDAQKLWKYNFGGMKKLVKTLPNACDIIDARLKIENQKKQKI